VLAVRAGGLAHFQAELKHLFLSTLLSLRTAVARIRFEPFGDLPCHIQPQILANATDPFPLTAPLPSCPTKHFTMMSQTSLILASVLALQCLDSSSSAVAGIGLTGQVTLSNVNGGPGAVVVRFLDTDFQGLTMEIETELDDHLGEDPEEGSNVTVHVPYQKLMGMIDCINDNAGEDNVVIVSGTIQGTANMEGFDEERYFFAGDRFMTAVQGNHQGNEAGNRDQIGEISNLGNQTEPDLSDCYYFFASDFELREVAGGHITVSN
jgi:hypothetical protein